MTYKEILNHIDKLPVNMVTRSSGEPNQASCNLHGMILKFDNRVKYIEVEVQTEVGEIEGAMIAVSVRARIPLDNIKDFDHLERIVLECKDLQL